MYRSLKVCQPIACFKHVELAVKRKRNEKNNNHLSDLSRTQASGNVVADDHSEGNWIVDIGKALPIWLTSAL